MRRGEFSVSEKVLKQESRKEKTERLLCLFELKTDELQRELNKSYFFLCTLKQFYTKLEDKKNKQTQTQQ